MNSNSLLTGGVESVFAHYLHALGVSWEEVGIISLFPRPTGYVYRVAKLLSTKAKSEYLLGGFAVTGEMYNAAVKLTARLLDYPKLELLIPLGAAPLLATIGKKDITSWQGSINTHYKLPLTVIPTYDPLLVTRKWEWLVDVKRAMGRARMLSRGEIMPKNERFTLNPSLPSIKQFLSAIPLHAHISVDIETACEHIMCIGIAINPTTAICIPFVDEFTDIYTEEEELEVILMLREVLTTRRVSGQNFHYDTQYIARWWGFIPNLWFDTMIAHHCLFPGMLKNLGYLSSVYIDYHVYWKDDHKDWRDRSEPEVLWKYNCRDCITTYELVDTIDKTIDHLDQREQYETQMNLWHPILHLMLRGFRRSKKEAERLSMSLLDEQHSLLYYVNNIVGFNLNPRSSKQMKEYFYDALQLPIIKSKATGNPTLAGEALSTLAKREPLIKPIADAINKYRNLGTIHSTFVATTIDSDNRIRTSLDQCGTETFRYASRTSVFHNGGNLQNVPKSVRTLFIPDQGMSIVDIDLAQADAQCVAWYAHDLLLMNLFKTPGSDLHQTNADMLGVSRKIAKMAVHAVNYGVGARTLGIGLGIGTKKAEDFRSKWFSIHPAIKQWHSSVQQSLMVSGSITNAFGYTRRYFERPDGLLPEALAWLGQSTVACLINRILPSVDAIPGVDLLLQVHDSIVFQCPTHKVRPTVRTALRCFDYPIPFKEPRIIPADAQVSSRSWGDVAGVDYK